jgi:hypothetical protein
MEDMNDRFCELCGFFGVLTWRKLGLVKHAAWMENFGWGNTSNVATCKSEGNY